MGFLCSKSLFFREEVLRISPDIDLEQEIDLEGAIVPMVTLNKIIGSIPVLGKILTNERKGIWSFVYNITGNLEEPEVKVNPIKTITPGFIQKFFSVFKKEKEEES